MPPRIQPRAEPDQTTAQESAGDKAKMEEMPSLNTVTRQTNQLMEVRQTFRMTVERNFAIAMT